MRPTLQCANRISFAVSVPVLSLNTKSTWPNSSMTEVFLAFACIPVLSSYISGSLSICMPMTRCRTSNAMYKVMGKTGYKMTKYFRNILYSGKPVCPVSREAKAKYALTTKRKLKMQMTHLFK